MKGKDHFFTSDKAVVDLYVDHALPTRSSAVTMVVTAETGRLVGHGEMETYTIEISGKYQMTQGVGTPSYVKRSDVDPVDAVEDIEDEDNRYLAESFYRFLADNPTHRINGHALMELVRELGWQPAEVVDTLQTELDDTKRELKDAEQMLADSLAAVGVEEEEDPDDDPDDEEQFRRMLDDPDQDYTVIKNAKGETVFVTDPSGRQWRVGAPTSKPDPKIFPPAPSIDDEAFERIKKRLIENEKTLNKFQAKTAEREKIMKKRIKPNEQGWFTKTLNEIKRDYYDL